MALLEVCVDSMAGMRAARDGGAQRLELCSRLDLGGLTPAAELVASALAESRLPCHVMLRPRAGSFTWSANNVAAIADELEALKDSGAHGFVLGALDARRDIDTAAVRRWTELARPLPVTFHRAFDEARDLTCALDALIELGVQRVLTSGGAATAWEGRAKLRELVERAAGRIVVMPGGGVREHNARALLEATGAGELHSSTPFHLRSSS
jgi:copper homeostasis protein